MKKIRVGSVNINGSNMKLWPDIKDEANMNNLEILAQTETHLRNNYNWEDNRRDRSEQMTTSRRWRRWWNGHTIKYEW